MGSSAQLTQKQARALEIDDGGPEDTLRIKVDPWTGQMTKSIARNSPNPSEADRTSRVRVNPLTGEILERIPLNDFSSSISSAPVLASASSSREAKDADAAQALPPLGWVATIAMTAGAAAGALVTLLIFA